MLDEPFISPAVSTVQAADDRARLLGLLKTAADQMAALGPEFDHYPDKRMALGKRFSEGRFHLAVLGQFKRGKSTLLNALFEKALKQSETERRLIQDVLEDDKKRVSAFLEEQSRELRTEAEAFLTEIMKQNNSGQEAAKTGKAGILNAWAEAIPEFFKQKQAALNEHIKERLMECLAPHEQRLDQLVETLRRVAADLFQAPYRSLGREEALEIKRKPYWVLNTWNTDALPILKSTEQRLDQLVRRNVENIRWATLQNLNLSFSCFASGVKDRLAETVAAAKGAMAAANARREAHGGSVESEVDRIAREIAGLEDLKAALAMIN